MAEVTGQIIGSDGTKDVRLNNAATEATLRALLANSSIDTASLRQIAARAGIDNVTLNNLSQEAAASSVSLQRAAVSTEQLTTSQNKLKEHSQLVDSSFYSLIESAKLLASGNASVSGVLSIFKGMPGPLGLVAQGFAALAAFQETNMKTYQSMSSAGANFGGSLTDMRLAAQGTFVTLEQFGNLVKNNSQVLGRMGGTVDDGARAFAAMSNSLLTSQAGQSLLSLGYTTEDVNQGMLSYIATTGGRSKEEMKNTQAITAATTEYMTELDKLTQFTGVSRKTQEEAQKKAAEQQAFQRKLAGMSEEERAKTMIAYNAAVASGIKGLDDLVISTTLGTPPMTEAARAVSGLAPEIANATVEMTNYAQTVGTTSEGVTSKLGNIMVAAQKQSDGIGGTADAITQMPGLMGEVQNSILGANNQMAAKGLKTADDVAKEMMSIQNKQKTQSESQAATMAKADIQLKEFGLAIMKLISPIISVLTPVLQYLGPLFIGLGVAVMGYKGWLLALETFERAKIARDLARESGSGVFAAAKNFVDLGGSSSPSTTLAGTAAKTAAGSATRTAAGAAGELIPGAAATSSGGGILGKVLGGLADGLKQMGDPKVMLGIVSVGLLGGAMLIAGKAFKEFTGINWGDVLIGSVVLTALAVGAAALVEIAPLIGISAVAIGLLGASIYVLAKGLKEFPSFAIPGMSEAFTGFGKIVSTVFDFVGGIVTGFVDTIKTVFGTVWDIISWPFKQIGNLLSGAVGIITGIFGIVWDVVSWPFKQLGSLVTLAVDGITGVFKGMVDGISAVFGTVWTIISAPFKMIGSLVTTVVEGISGAIKWVVDKLSNVLGMIGSVIKGIAGFVGSLFSGSDNKKDEKGVSGSPEFTKATAVLLEAANKMNVAGDKLIASAAALGKNSAVAGPSVFDKVLSAAGLDRAMSDMKQKALNLPPISDEAKNIAASIPEERGPSLEEKTHTELVSLNSTMKDLLRYIKDTADNTRKTHEATKNLNGNAFA